MRLIAAVTFVAAAALLPGAAAAEQDKPSTEARLAAVEEAQKAILKELQEIKALLLARPANPAPAAAAKPASPPGIPAFDLTVAGSPAKGRADAPIVIVEFSDFQCPFCARYVRDTWPSIEREYIDTGKVRYVFRHSPIQAIHPQAMGAAQAGVCAAAQNKFWELHAEMFANQRALQPEALAASAQKVGLNADAFQRCMSEQAKASPSAPRSGAKEKVQQDLEEGNRAVISGTPTFFLGTMTKDGKVKVARRLVGAQSFAAFKTVIDGLLSTNR